MSIKPTVFPSATPTAQAPKPHISGYNIFVRDVHRSSPNVRADLIGHNVSEAEWQRLRLADKSRIIGPRWRGLSPAAKETYEERRVGGASRWSEVVTPGVPGVQRMKGPEGVDWDAMGSLLDLLDEQGDVNTDPKVPAAMQKTGSNAEMGNVGSRRASADLGKEVAAQVPTPVKCPPIVSEKVEDGKPAIPRPVPDAATTEPVMYTVKPAPTPASPLPEAPKQQTIAAEPRKPFSIRPHPTTLTAASRTTTQPPHPTPKVSSPAPTLSGLPPWMAPVPHVAKKPEAHVQKPATATPPPTSTPQVATNPDAQLPKAAPTPFTIRPYPTTATTPRRPTPAMPAVQQTKPAIPKVSPSSPALSGLPPWMSPVAQVAKEPKPKPIAHVPVANATPDVSKDPT
ncbi:hypothetical protein HK104_004213, partial [Borealophlyctis nickersoniae]